MSAPPLDLSRTARQIASLRVADSLDDLNTRFASAVCGVIDIDPTDHLALTRLRDAYRARWAQLLTRG